MAELIFFTGPMDCGKSTLALQMDYTQSAQERSGRLFTCHDRAGDAVVSSRIGLSKPAIEVSEEFDFWRYIVAELTVPLRVDYLICDEAQFYTAAQVEQLARIADELQLDVYCFGIMADFRTRLFPGSQRLVELADRVETLPVRPLCWCGKPGTHNARIVNGVMTQTGSQIVVGDTGESDAQVVYEVLCRSHHRRNLPRQKAMATLYPDQLPFGG